MSRNKTGIIGGSGLDNPHILSSFKEVTVKTPYGLPSDKLVTGSVAGKEVVILARHGKKHSIPPTHVPYRANIWALKELGCNRILATTACGSLRNNFRPGDFVFIDQFIDFTKQRGLSFFEDSVVHTPMAHPFDAGLRKILIQAARRLNIKYHPGGTMLTIEGPRFSTRAESFMFKKWGADVINMSTVPEVSLANELLIPYQSIAMVTDYDCWKENEEPVTFDLIIKRMKENAEKVKRLLLKTVEMLL